MKQILFSLILVLLILPFIVNGAVTDNIVVYHKMDNVTTSGSTSIDSTGNQNGTLVGSAASSGGGIILDSYAADGEGNYIDMGTPLMPATGDFTINGWWQGNTDSDIDVIFSQYALGQAGRWILDYDWTNNKWEFSCITTGESYPDASVTINTWYSVTFTRKGNTFSLYIDGDYKDGCTNSGSLYTGGNFQLGWDISSTRSVGGKVDEFGFWNVTKNSTEILELYNLLANGTSYPFSEAISPVTLSDYNYTANNLASGGNRTAWNTNGSLVNITSNLATGTFTASENSNCTGRIDIEQNYTQMLAFNSQTKFATTETTSHSFTLYENITIGNHCIYISCIGTSGNEPASGATSSGCLNITRLNNLPQVTLNTPTNASTEQNLSVVLNVTVTDSDNHTMNVSFYKSDNTLIGTVINVINNTDVNVTWSGLAFSTTYNWFVNVTDSLGLTTSSIWQFTTKDDLTANISDTYCTSQSINYTFDFNISLYNFTGDTLTEQNVKVYNVTRCLFNLTNNGDAIGNFSIKINSTSSEHNVTAYGNNTFNLTTSFQTLWIDVPINASRLTNLTMNYINTNMSADWWFEVSFNAT